jgi:hypothetical protein
MNDSSRGQIVTSALDSARDLDGEATLHIPINISPGINKCGPKKDHRKTNRQQPI